MAQLSLRRESPGAVIRVFPWVIWIRRAARGRTEFWCIRSCFDVPLTRARTWIRVAPFWSLLLPILILLHSRRRPALTLWELFGSEVVPYYFKVFL